MRRVLWLMVALVAMIPLLSFAQSGQQQYAGQERREIKALSAAEVEAYLSGQGMGLAKVAELNHYPGPRHVLELAAPLRLSEQQRAETQRAFAEMRGEALRLGRLIVDRERELDDSFARNEIDAARLQTLGRGIALLQGSLRVAHLRAHLEMKRILSPEQIERYDHLRGYTAPGARRDAPEHHRGKH